MQNHPRIGLGLERLERLMTRARPALRVARWALPILLLSILAYGLSRIGWSRVWAERPGSPLFYLVILVPFFLQPLADLIIYRRLLGAGVIRFAVLLRKQSLNVLVLNYSGEAYFFHWLHRNLRVSKASILHAIKDTNVLSASASLVMVLASAIGLALSGDLKLAMLLSGGVWPLVLLGLLPVLLGVGLVAGGSRVTTLSRNELGLTFGIFLARSCLFFLIGVFVWWLSGALPSLRLCVEFVTARLLFSRLPLPNRGLLFAGIAISLAGMLDLSAPRMAAVLIITALYEQVLSFAFVGVPWALEHLSNRRKQLDATA